MYLPCQLLCKCRLLRTNKVILIPVGYVHLSSTSQTLRFSLHCSNSTRQSICCLLSRQWMYTYTYTYTMYIIYFTYIYIKHILYIHIYNAHTLTHRWTYPKYINSAYQYYIRWEVGLEIHLELNTQIQFIFFITYKVHIITVFSCVEADSTILTILFFSSYSMSQGIHPQEDVSKLICLLTPWAKIVANIGTKK